MNHSQGGKRNLCVAAITSIAATILLGLPDLLFNQATPSAHAITRQTERPVANSKATNDRPAANLLASSGAAALLYDQTANGGPISSASQNLGFSSAFSTEAADDFIVPSGRIWTIQQVSVLGVYTGFSSVAVTVNVALYSDSSGLPGSLVCAYSDLVPLDTEGDFVIALPSPCALSSGHYWVEVQANSNTSPRRWFWTEQTVKTNFESVWRNPRGGFGRCTTFMPRLSTCAVGADPDLSFQILGQDAAAFDYCVQDESNGNQFQLSSSTGDYQFTNCSGITLGGRGSVTVKGSTITLQHYASDRRTLVRIDGSSHRATGSIQFLPQGITFSLADRNTADSKCSCFST